MTDGLVEGLNLLGLQVADDGVDGGQQLVYEGHHLSHLTTKNVITNKKQILNVVVYTRVADPHSFDPDPNPAF